MSKSKKKQDRPDPGYTYNADDLGIGLPTPKKQRNTRKGGYSYNADDLDEKADMTKPGWMLKADPELGKKIKAKQKLEKKRQDSYGDPSKGISDRIDK